MRGCFPEISYQSKCLTTGTKPRAHTGSASPQPEAQNKNWRGLWNILATVDISLDVRDLPMFTFTKSGDFRTAPGEHCTQLCSIAQVRGTFELLTLPTPFKDWDFECRVLTVGFTRCWGSDLGPQACEAGVLSNDISFQPEVIRHLKHPALSH